MLISEIIIYPIKSLKGIALTDSVVEKRGLRYDRRWMLTDPDGMFFTQREVPKMAAVTVRVESGELRVESDGAGEMAIPFEPDRGLCRMKAQQPGFFRYISECAVAIIPQERIRDASTLAHPRAAQDPDVKPAVIVVVGLLNVQAAHHPQ